MTRCLTVFTLLLGLSLALAPAQAPKPLVPINLPVNTAGDESDPHVTSNQLTLFYAANAGMRWEIMAATRKTASAAWTSGTPVPEIKSKDADFRGPFLTPDGKYPQRLYYCSNMDPLSDGAKGDNFDIYSHAKFDAKGGFGSYNALVTVGTDKDEMFPWLTADDRQVYLSRLTEGGWRLFAAARPKDGGQFAAPVQVKLPLGFHHATLTPDAKTMYLQGPVASQGKGQRWGLFVTTSADGKTWAKPAPLSRLNSDQGTTGDQSPSLSRDGKLLYFASDRPGGKGGLDIYVVATAELKK